MCMLIFVTVMFASPDKETSEIYSPAKTSDNHASVKKYQRLHIAKTEDLSNKENNMRSSHGKRLLKREQMTEQEGRELGVKSI